MSHGCRSNDDPKLQMLQDLVLKFQTLVSDPAGNPYNYRNLTYPD